MISSREESRGDAESSSQINQPHPEGASNTNLSRKRDHGSAYATPKRKTPSNHERAP